MMSEDLGWPSREVFLNEIQRLQWLRVLPNKYLASVQAALLQRNVSPQGVQGRDEQQTINQSSLYVMQSLMLDAWFAALTKSDFHQNRGFGNVKTVFGMMPP